LNPDSGAGSWGAVKRRNCWPVEVVLPSMRRISSARR
jgi:hypothetical protein